MTTTEPPEPVICGTRETRPDGNYECIERPEHTDRGHVWFRLVSSEPA
jgi:hypothetical protein